VRRLLVTASVVPSLPILVTLMKEALSSPETSVLTRATRRNITEAFLESECFRWLEYLAQCGLLATARQALLYSILLGHNEQDANGFQMEGGY
jgi:hypothetical protein